MTPAALRLFCALELPEAAVGALAAFAARAADPAVWRPVRPESLHVTLAFLGRTDPGAVVEIEDALRGAVEPGTPAPRLALAGGLSLPPRRPRVLAVALDDPDGTLAALQARVSDALAATGAYEAERRAFRPHVTVARVRPRARALREIVPAPEPLEFLGGAVTLFSSHTAPDGARYMPLASMSLETGRIDD